RHASSLHRGILDRAGQVVLDPNIAARPEAFLRAIAPFRPDLVVGAECMDAGYGLADRCTQAKRPVALGHALDLKLIDGAQAKNDQIDAGQIARRLKGGHFALAYVYPKGLRETRALRRRRPDLVRQRSGLFTHLQILTGQYNLPPVPKKLSFAAN